MTANELRQKYLDFFKSKGHAIIPSASLIPENDPTTLFVGSGMQSLFMKKLIQTKNIIVFLLIFLIGSICLFTKVSILYANEGESIYNKDYYKVYCRDKELTGADYDTFEILGTSLYAKDKNNVYRRGFLMDDVDPGTFEILGGDYTKDKNNIYLQGRVIEGCDPNTFVYLGFSYAKDKNNAYSFDKIIKDADADTFTALNYIFAKDKNSGYYQRTKIEGSDSNTFTALNGYYAKDKNYGYYRAWKVKESDGETFEAIEDVVAKDKNHYYTYDKIVDESKAWFYIRYEKKDLTGTCHTEVHTEVDQTSYEELDNGFARDKNCLYYEGFRINKSHPDSYTLIDNEFAKDKNYIYHYQNNTVKRLEYSDPNTFATLGYSYAKDKYIAYYQGEEIKNSDPATFQVTCRQDNCTFNAIDKNNYYHKDQNKYIDKATRQLFNEAAIVFGSGIDLSLTINHNKLTMNVSAQEGGMEKYTNSLVANQTDLTVNNIYAINNFIVYGTETTGVLGVGERAGVINSYKSTYNKLPVTEQEWQDLVKIANGRWPTEINTEAEAEAKEKFKVIYEHEPNMGHPHENAAVTIMAYGLRPAQRNLDSEKAANEIFTKIFNYNPSSASDWDIVRAIAYSGARRY